MRECEGDGDSDGMGMGMWMGMWGGRRKGEGGAKEGRTGELGRDGRKKKRRKKKEKRRTLREKKNSVSKNTREKKKEKEKSTTDLDELVPPGRDDDRVGRRGREPHARHPLRVPVGLADRVLALADRVPQLDRAVARPRHDLPVVDREGDREDVLGVAEEAARGGARGEVPQPEGAVPRAGERELAVGRDDDVLDEVRVAAERAARVAVGGALLAREVPDDDRLVARGGEDDVGGRVERGGDGGDPAGVALEGAAEGEGLGHFLLFCCCWGQRGRSELQEEEERRERSRERGERAGFW